MVLVYAVTSFWVLRLEKTGAALVADDYELGAARGMHVRQDEHDFFFAVAVSSKTNFKGQSAAKFIEQGGKVSLSYGIRGGYDDGKVFDIDLIPCKEETVFFRGNPDPEVLQVVQAH